jgi:hypothetical protein
MPGAPRRLGELRESSPSDCTGVAPREYGVEGQPFYGNVYVPSYRLLRCNYPTRKPHRLVDLQKMFVASLRFGENAWLVYGISQTFPA